ncbi:MAG: helix-turn-helix transcriptional regulator [Actinomycetota bacterium]|nr:helix-turn-helix transcriptional regulator [Actinomycetota bacterium]
MRLLLKLIRESAGLTQVQLAERLGVDMTSVQGKNTGELLESEGARGHYQR